VRVSNFKKFVGFLRRKLIEVNLIDFVEIRVDVYDLSVEVYVKHRLKRSLFDKLIDICKSLGMRYNPKRKCWCKYDF